MSRNSRKSVKPIKCFPMETSAPNTISLAVSLRAEPLGADKVPKDSDGRGAAPAPLKKILRRARISDLTFRTLETFSMNFSEARSLKEGKRQREGVILKCSFKSLWKPRSKQRSRRFTLQNLIPAHDAKAWERSLARRSMNVFLDAEQARCSRSSALFLVRSRAWES